MQYNYNYGDGGIVDEQTAEFAQMQDGFKQANKDSKGETCVNIFAWTWNLFDCWHFSQSPQIYRG